MSEFEVLAVNLDKVSRHPNADKLDIAEIGGYQAVVAKDEFKTGDLAVYIPEQAILPDDLIEMLGLTGRLSGSQKNRVKAVKLRGVLSQGLVCPVKFVPNSGPGKIDLQPGDDVRKALGIVKYEPQMPGGGPNKVKGSSSNVWNAGLDRCIRYDIENIKKYNKVLQDGEEVVFTEKLHGTWCMAAWMPLHLGDPEQGNVFVSSKGHASKGLCLRRPTPPTPQKFLQKLEEKYWEARKSLSLWASVNLNQSERDIALKQAYFARKIRGCYNPGVNKDNIYWRAVDKAGVFRNVFYAFPADIPLNRPIFVLGEVFGAGVQDLGYGSTKQDPGFRVFDIYVGIPGAGRGRYLSDAELDKTCEALGLERVPVLYRGPFSQKKLEEFTSGRETVSGKSMHIREGIVIRPVEERSHVKLGRVQLKSVSEKYLLRKNGTEFN